MWEAGDIPVPASSGQQSKGGQSESDPTQPVMGGQGISTSTTSKVKTIKNCQEYRQPKNPSQISL